MNLQKTITICSWLNYDRKANELKQYHSHCLINTLVFLLPKGLTG